MANWQNRQQFRDSGDQDVATLYFRVLTDEEFEPRAWSSLRDRHQELKDEIGEAVAGVLGTEFTVSRLNYNPGSVEILIGIAGTAFAAYSGISKYKNFVESLTRLVSDVRTILRKFFMGLGSGVSPAVKGTWMPSPQLLERFLVGTSGIESALVKPLLWYLIVTHAALLAVVIWKLTGLP